MNDSSTSLAGTGVDPRGLSAAEAARRLDDRGPNTVTARREETFWDELLESLREPLVLLLIAVGVLYFMFGEVRDALIVLGVIVTVAITEAGIEWRAGRAVAALAALAEPKALVWRDGALAEHPAETLVPGDLLELRAGSRVPADARLIVAQDIAVDESLVTGESEPVPHDTQNPELLAGALVVRGAGRAEVTRTGAESTLGRIAELVAATKEPKTPLQRRMSELARTLLWAAVAVSVVIPVIGVLGGQPPMEMLLTGLSLAFATIPEELAVLIVVVLGMGSLKLARRGAIVRQLRAAETLGAVTTICTDKTGTLTVNRMTLDKTVSAAALLGEEGAADGLIVRAAALASEPMKGGAFIDPMDTAIRAAAPEIPEGAQFPFDQARRLASGYAGIDGGHLIGVKGAPEAVLAHCSAYRTADGAHPLDQARREALSGKAAALGQGGRVLGIASRSVKARPMSRDEAENDLVFEGVVVLRDPVRPEVAPAIDALRGAGVGVTVITGDQPTTAARVAEEAGIDVQRQFLGSDLSALSEPTLAEKLRDGAIVARAQPGDKLRIVQALTDAGGVVMVTGDGVNDAPALAQADVGLAMGTGSDVALEAAGVTLVKGDLRGIAKARRLSWQTMRNVRQNLFFAFFYNAAGIPLAAGVLYLWLGWLLSPMFAAAAMSLSSVSVIANALRLRKARL